MPTDDPAADGPPFPYLAFAKAHLAWDAPNNLGMSGTVPPGAALAGRLGISQSPAYGLAVAGFKDVLSARYGLPPEQIHVASGTSHANFAAYLGLARGGRIAVEAPGYQALSAIGLAMGATAVPFMRHAATGFALDADTLREAARGAQLIVVSDLHNPTGVRLTPEDFALLEAVADEENAWILVDEVYAAFDDDRTVATAATRGPRYVTTCSLTKVWGLGDLRAGWVFGPVEAIQRIGAWDDLVNPMLPAACLRDAATALENDADHLAAIRERAALRRDVVHAWIQATSGVSWVRPDGGITGFVQLTDAEDPAIGDAVAARLIEAHGVLVVPGSYFQCPSCIRISYDVPDDTLGRCLDLIARVVSKS